MAGYYLKRLLWTIPSIFLLLIFVFLLSNATEKDSVEAVLLNQGISFESSPDYHNLYIKEYRKQKKHLPLFYFSVLPNHYPDTLNFIENPEKRTFIKGLLKEGYDMKTIRQWDLLIEKIEKDTSISVYGMKARTPAQFLSSKQISILPPQDQTAIRTMASKEGRFHWPILRFYGSSNQFHYWINNIAKGDWGTSFLDGTEVKQKVGKALAWTTTLMAINLFLLFLMGIPIVFLAVYKNGIVGQIIEWVSLLIYTIPIFWLATLVQVYLMSPEYSMKIFPSYQEDYFASTNFVSLLNNYFTKYLPAVFCLLLADLAVFIRLLKGNVLKEMLLPYVRTAQSKGASKGEILYRHVLPNSIIPLITLFVGSVPLFISGSLIIEVIFNIPGMGRLLFRSISEADWAVVYFIVLLIGLTTMIFYLLGDLLYQYFDPKIKLGKDVA